MSINKKECEGIKRKPGVKKGATRVEVNGLNQKARGEKGTRAKC